MKRARVLLVEDHPAMRLGIRTVLGLEGGVEIVGEAPDAAGALRLASELRPDLVLLDLRLRGGDGLPLCRSLKCLADPPYVLVYTAYNAPAEVREAMLCGADSFVHKGEDPARLREAVRETCAGKRVWLLGEQGDEAGPAALTPREREVYERLLLGHPNRQIAEELGVSLPTVKSHVTNILKKLGVSSRRDLLPGDGEEQL